MKHAPKYIPTEEQVNEARTWIELAQILGIHPRNSRAMAPVQEYVKEHYPNNKLFRYGTRRYTKITDEEFSAIVGNTFSYRQLMEQSGYTVAGGTYKVVRDRIKRLGLSTDHFLGQAHNRGKISRNKLPIENFLVNGRTISGNLLKKKLFEEGLKNKCCEWCGLTEWRGQDAPLELDHVNGEHDDNRFENLRILCANCHAQTLTASGKHKSRKTNCPVCNVPKLSIRVTCGNMKCISTHISETKRKTTTENGS